MTKISNVRKITKFKRSIKAISPVIATLLMIAIAVVASLVVYAWVTGYIGGTTSTAGKAIQIQSFAVDPTSGKLHVYVQNVGQGAVTLSTAYVNSTLQAITPDANYPDNVLTAGNTADIIVAGAYAANDKIDLKITTTEGTFMTATGTVSSGGSSNPTPTPLQYAVNFVLGGSGGLSMNPSGSQNVGGSVSITATASTGNHFTSWSSSTGSITFADANAASTTATVNGAGTITANFAADTVQYTITVNPGANGGITPATGLVNAGTSPTYTITATNGYHIVDVQVDTVSQGAVGTYTFTNVQAAHTISATFAIDTTSFATTTTLGAISTPLTPGQTGVAFSGSVSASTAVPNGQPVVLQYSTSTTGPWTTAATVNTASGTGAFSGTFTAPAAGTYYFQAYFTAYTSGTNTWQTSTSGQQTIAVSAGIVRVQGVARGTSTTSPISVTLTSTPTSGNVLIAVIGTYRDSGSNVRTVSSITETGVTWTKQISSTDTNTNPTDIEIWLGIVGSGASKSISIALSGSPENGAVADICEYSGIATTSSLDRSTAGTPGSSATTVTGTTATTTQAKELWIGGITVESSASQSTPANGFTLLDGANTGVSTSIGYLEKIVSGTGAASSGTTTTSSHRFVGCIATFKGT